MSSAQLYGMAFASKAILRKRPVVVAVSHLLLHLTLNNSYILEEKKTDNPFKTQ